jgi:hypothetical protein
VGWRLRSSDSDASAAELVVTVAPTDDTGAHTADLYDWQAVMAAADGLRLYLDALDGDGRLSEADGCRIICERHEDWVVLRGGDAELVSAKHPGLSFGAYTTMKALVSDGGLAHLFDRWLTMQEKVTCRLVTTAGLDGPVKKLREIMKTLQQRRLAGLQLISDGEFEEHLTAFGKALLKYCHGLSEKWAADCDASPHAVPAAAHQGQIARFLSMLTFQESIRKEYVEFAGPRMYAEPVINKLSVSGPPDAVWEAVVLLFRARMRAAGPTPTAGLPSVLANPIGASPLTPAEVEGQLDNRIVTLTDIHVAIRTAIAYPKGFGRLPPLVRTGRLAVKMEVGGCSDNAVERAEHLRRDYRELWRDRLAVDPMARAEQARLHRILLRISDTATSAVRAQGTFSGEALWRELEAQLTLQSAFLPDRMDVDLALGGVCELSSRCQVWFSESFDIDTELARRRGERGGDP